MSPTPAQNQEVEYKSVIAVEKEIETYRNHPPSPQDQSVLLWRKSRQNILPRLSVLASYILAFPASSSVSERLFSKAGLLDSQRRSRLSLTSLETKVKLIISSLINLYCEYSMHVG